MSPRHTNPAAGSGGARGSKVQSHTFREEGRSKGVGIRLGLPGRAQEGPWIPSRDPIADIDEWPFLFRNRMVRVRVRLCMRSVNRFMASFFTIRDPYPR